MTEANEVQIVKDPKTGAPLVAVVPYAKYEAMIEALEDQEDLAAVARADARLGAGEETYPSELVEALLGSDGNRVRVWREYRGLSQTVLAGEARVPQSTISDLENGKQSASVETYQRIARALNAPIELVLPRLTE